MSVLLRLFKIGQAEANQALDKLEDPVAMFEQGVKDLRKELGEIVQARAQAKPLADRSEKEYETAKARLAHYVESLEKLQGQADKKELYDRTLAAARTIEGTLPGLKTQAEADAKTLAGLDTNIRTHQEDIVKYEAKSKALKMRAQAAQGRKKINMRLAGVTGSSAREMLERMEKQVEQTEGEANSYGDTAKMLSQDSVPSLDEELRQALPPPAADPASDLSEIERLKASLSK